MYKDIISYELAENVTLEQLTSIAGRIVNDWMKNQTGFVKWEINSNSDGSYTDIVYWNSKEDAQKAEKEMVNIPDAAEWFGCYKKGSIASKNLTTVVEF